MCTYAIEITCGWVPLAIAFYVAAQGWELRVWLPSEKRPAPQAITGHDRSHLPFGMASRGGSLMARSASTTLCLSSDVVVSLGFFSKSMVDELEAARWQSEFCDFPFKIQLRKSTTLYLSILQVEESLEHGHHPRSTYPMVGIATRRENCIA